jgi:FMN phosphatase YigB (HAD superfamily)
MDRASHAVIFDIGATLILGPFVSPAKQLVTRLSLPPSMRHTLSARLMTSPVATREDVEAVLREVAGSALVHTAAEIAHVIEVLLGEQLSAPHAVEGSVESVARLAGAGYKLGLCSNIWAPYFGGFQRAWGGSVAPFAYRFLSYERGRAKPSPEVFATITADLGIAPSRCLMVGDTYTHDIAPAMAAGWKTAWILSRPAEESDALANVLNLNGGAWARPSATLPRIGDLTPERVDAIFAMSSISHEASAPADIWLW